jgi:hypothetical protein
VDISKEKLEDLWINQKLNLTQISKIFKCSRCTVENYTKKYNIDRPIKISNTPQNIENIKNLYLNKYKSLLEIAKIYNVHQSTMALFLKNNNIPVRLSIKHHRFTDKDIENIKKLWGEDKSINYIAKLYKTDNLTMSRFMIRYKIRCKNDRNKTIYKRIISENPIIKNQIIDLYTKQNKNIKDIVKIIHKTNGYIKNLLIRNNIPIKNKSQAKIGKYNAKKIIDMYTVQNNSIEFIAKHENMWPNSVKNVLIKNGIKIRSSNDPITFQNSFKAKKYKLPSGKIIYKQGYEPFFMDYVFQNNLLKEEEIDYRPKAIRYVDKEGKSRNYMPDFYIPKYNLIVEIKSTYVLETYDKFFPYKKQATLDKGFKYILCLDNIYDEFADFIKYQITSAP